MTRLLRAHMPVDTVELAYALIGTRLIRQTEAGRSGGRIVEVEAYPPGDPASHAFAGERPRCAAMFLGHWYLYVYLIYGVSWCANVVSEAHGVGAAVLLRALEPDDGLELIAERRAGVRPVDFARGPGRLAAALAIGKAQNGLDLDAAAELWLEPGRPAARIASSPRIGITRAAEAPLRFFDADSPAISGSPRRNALAAARDGA